MVELNIVQNADQDSDHLVSISVAANLLGTSRDAIRMRIRRGTLPAVKRDGQWYVSVQGERPGEPTTDSDQNDHPERDQGTVPTTELVAQLRDEVGFLREELRRKDALLAAFAQRIPQLDAPQEPTRPVEVVEKRRRWWQLLIWGA